MVDTFIANATGVAAITVARALTRVGDPGDAHVEDDANEDLEDVDPFLMAINAVLSNAVSGHPFSDYNRVANLLRLASCKIPGKYLNWSFPRAIEFIALTEVVKPMLRNVLFHSLPSLGIQSDVSLFADGGTIGQVFRSVRSTVLAIGLGFSVQRGNLDSDAVKEQICKRIDGCKAYTYLAIN